MKINALAVVAALIIVAPGAAPADPGTAAEARVGGSTKTEDEAARRYFTDTELVDQHGVPRRFYSDILRGRKVLINVAFTACKGVCPTMTANLARVQRLLRARGRQATMVTITIDPTNDTPEALRRYAARQNAGPGWLFLTGAPDNVHAVLKRLGGDARKPDEHTSTLLIGDASRGVWLKTSAMDPPEVIADLVGRLDPPPAPAERR